MAFFNKYPYTDFHEMNLDWILDTMKKLEDKYDNTLTAELKAFIESKFNDLFVDCAYDADHDRLVLHLGAIAVAGEEHIYRADDETITIV